ncbi:hypothetical protein AC578_10354 [Pseudocercospora eumusae]|uniref:Uncharacterized protein n=1 Tax=Pseudocercospora eumusae TaxID=321146 RepID=A0A139HRA0_9PEZI|nr:hypothetical protein AC578_10354 [Pseudocercospora eumusae]
MDTFKADVEKWMITDKACKTIIRLSREAAETFEDVVVSNANVALLSGDKFDSSAWDASALNRIGISGEDAIPDLHLASSDGCSLSTATIDAAVDAFRAGLDSVPGKFYIYEQECDYKCTSIIPEYKIESLSCSIGRSSWPKDAGTSGAATAHNLTFGFAALSKCNESNSDGLGRLFIATGTVVATSNANLNSTAELASNVTAWVCQQRNTLAGIPVTTDPTGALLATKTNGSEIVIHDDPITDHDMLLMFHGSLLDSSNALGTI